MLQLRELRLKRVQKLAVRRTERSDGLGVDAVAEHYHTRLLRRGQSHSAKVSRRTRRIPAHDQRVPGRCSPTLTLEPLGGIVGSAEGRRGVLARAPGRT